MQMRSIDFLREVAAPVRGQLPRSLRGPSATRRRLLDERTITADEAEDYHWVQLDTLAEPTSTSSKR